MEVWCEGLAKFPNWVRSCVLCQRYKDGECIPASAMWGDKKRIDTVILQLAYKKKLSEIYRERGKDFAEVERGRQAHESLERRRRVIEDLSEVVERLRKGDAKVPFTARACSRYYGQRCLPDVVYFTLRQEGRVPELDVHIVEDKKEFRPTYLMQLYAMGIIFTDFHVMVQAKAKEEPATDLEREFMENGVFLYDFLKKRLDLRDLRVNVFVSLNVYGDTRQPVDNPLFTDLFSSDFKVDPKFEKSFLSTRRRRNEIIKALEKGKPYVVSPKQTHFTTRPRRKSKVVARLNDKYTLYLPGA
jgi:hypothetical protein